MRNTRTVVSSGLLMLVAPVAVAAYLFLSSPEGVVVSTEGEVLGLFNKVRSHLQRGGFWEHQLAEAKRDLEWLRSATERGAERKVRIDSMVEHIQHRREKDYEQNPKLRPSPAAIEVARLREAADDIEKAEFEERRERRRQSQMLELEKIIQVIQSKNQ